MTPDISSIPSIPAVYALLSGRGKKAIVYVGTTDNLRRRIRQHLILQDSSVTTAGADVKINVSNITEVRWWTDDRFFNSVNLEAAEEIGFSVLRPVLTSRGIPSKNGVNLMKDENFRSEMESLFKNEPSGRFQVVTIQDLVMQIEKLEKEIERLKNKQI